MKQAYGGTGMEHPGPTQVYMSKATGGDVKSCTGNGSRFKAFQSILCSSGDAAAFQNDAWCMYGQDRIEFTVPDTIPEGEYLVGVEQIAIHGAQGGNAEFYYSCAQVKVEGTTATTTPTPEVEIPGVYAADDAAINFSVWGTSTAYPELPGPDVVAGGQIEGSTDGKILTTSIVDGASNTTTTSEKASTSSDTQYLGSCAAQVRRVLRG